MEQEGLDRGGERRERRRKAGDFRVRPRPSAANLLVLTVTGALLATAAATVLTDGGFTDSTPHGQLLGVLREVSEAQEAEYARTGQFARWLHTLELSSPEAVRVSVVRADSVGWEVVATHRDVNLSCAQSGRVDAGQATRGSPVCFTRSTD